jgi:predicted RNase H-like HicB family nuclease
MTRDFSVIIERDAEGFYVATVPEVRGCHTQARSLDELLGRVKEAIQVCLEAEGDDAETLDFIGVQKITLGS